MRKPRSNIEAELFSLHAEVCKVFSHPKRLELISFLRDKEHSVGEIAKELNISIGNLSQHLAMMKQRRIFATRKAGNVVYYRLANPKLLKAFDLIREILIEQMEHEGAILKEAKR